jgi:hypothetical protein
MIGKARQLEQGAAPTGRLEADCSPPWAQGNTEDSVRVLSALFPGFGVFPGDVYRVVQVKDKTFAAIEETKA